MTPSTQSRIRVAEYLECNFILKSLIRHSARSCCAIFFFQFANATETGRPKQLSRSKPAVFGKRLEKRAALCRDCLVESTPRSPQPLFIRQSEIAKHAYSWTMVSCER